MEVNRLHFGVLVPIILYMFTLCLASWV